MPDWDITLTPVSEAYSGEISTVEVKVSKSCVIKLLVDGTEKKSTTGTALSYDVSSLPTGTHSIKVSVDDGVGVYEKSFSCKIVDKPKTYQKPTLTCQKVMQSYLGEHAEITASTKTDSKITLYVDGVEKASSSTKSLRYDVAGLAIGTYTIKIVATNGDKKDEVSFNCVISKKTVVIKYSYVDLGLPTGTLWATTNVGAENPWDYGAYFAWGETEPKEVYSEDTYKYHDSPSILDATHDAATVNCGSDWRMPTNEEFQELIDNCDWEWTENYNHSGIDGCVFKSRSNTNTIFIPVAGYRKDSKLYNRGVYWSLSVYSSSASSGLKFTSDDVSTALIYRYVGLPIRAVRVEKTAPAKVEIEMSMPSSLMTEGEKYMVYCKVNRNCSILFYIDDNKACTEIPGTSNGFYWQLSAYKPGTHTLTARAYIDGNVVAEKSATYTVEAKQQPISTDYVDLGLPSGTLWATCNVGAENPWDYGDYFAWGETKPKEVYSEDTYTYHDNPSVLDAAHDAATVNWGNDWRMPTREEYQELIDNCDWEWTEDYNNSGVAGSIFKSRSNTNTIFFPAAGFRYEYGIKSVGVYGYYNTSTFNFSNFAWGLYFDDSSRYLGCYARYSADPVRAVRCKN